MYEALVEMSLLGGGVKAFKMQRLRLWNCAWIVFLVFPRYTFIRGEHSLKVKNFWVFIP